MGRRGGVGDVVGRRGAGLPPGAETGGAACAERARNGGAGATPPSLPQPCSVALVSRGGCVGGVRGLEAPPSAMALPLWLSEGRAGWGMGSTGQSGRVMRVGEGGWVGGGRGGGVGEGWGMAWDSHPTSRHPGSRRSVEGGGGARASVAAMALGSSAFDFNGRGEAAGSGRLWRVREGGAGGVWGVGGARVGGSRPACAAGGFFNRTAGLSRGSARHQTLRCHSRWSTVWYACSRAQRLGLSRPSLAKRWAEFCQPPLLVWHRRRWPCRDDGRRHHGGAASFPVHHTTDGFIPLSFFPPLTSLPSSLLLP